MLLWVCKICVDINKIDCIFLHMDCLQLCFEMYMLKSKLLCCCCAGKSWVFRRIPNLAL